MEQIEPIAHMEPITHIEPNTEGNIQLIIDYREGSLIDALNAARSMLAVPINMSIANLELGDIQIISTLANFPFVLVFERKTVADLAASIKDHRYSEQKARMLSAHMPHMCTYVIEGTNYGETMSSSSVNQSTLDGALIHTLYRDKMHVVCTRNVKATAHFLLTVLTKCKGHPEYFGNIAIDGGGASNDTHNSNTSYVSLLKHKTRKIANIDKESCYIMQLCQIPGISHIIATEIAMKYPSMYTFLSALHMCANQEEKIKVLKSINNIADKKAKLILEFMG